MDPMRRSPWFPKKTFQILIPFGMLLAVAAGVFWRQNLKPVIADRTPFAKGTAPRPSDIHLDAETEQKIRDLIEQLASTSQRFPKFRLRVIPSFPRKRNGFATNA
jgi:hypothetical protein